MKVIVNALLVLFSLFSLTAQSYLPDEFIIEYKETASAADQQAVRDLYGITNHIRIAEGVEIWRDIDFPVSITENGSTTTINNVGDLLEYIIEIQNGNAGNTNANANINNGDPNYILQLPDDDLIYDGNAFDPLPFCDNSLNQHLIGPSMSENNSVATKVIIIDQQINSPMINHVPINHIEFLQVGGLHGNRVFSVIDNQLQQLGIPARYYGVTLFDVFGQAEYGLLLLTLNQLLSHDDLSNSILNFSANLVALQADTDLLLWDVWDDLLTEQNILLVSSAGNQGMNSDNIYPGCAGWANEITVAGTEGCFDRPWSSSNSNPQYFEIATEASEVLTYDGDNYWVSFGTSFSSALVTGAAAQIAARCQSFDPQHIKSALLDHADVNPNLMGLVNGGKLLNVTASINNMPSCNGSPPPFGNPRLIGDEESKLSLQTSPNPFSQVCMLTIDVPIGISAQVSLYNSVGQLVAEEHIPNQQELTVLEWYTPQNLSAGTYFLQVQAGEAIQQQMIIKQ